ncbi:hypothetical protein TNCV_3142011 [Trichonephila clavipes]|nr:hypothetical protein TNCV_3142011 [Trichonephila clavipes]
MGAECEVAGRYDRHSGSNSLSNVFLDSGGKKMSSNIFWIPEEDEILIDFVMIAVKMGVRERLLYSAQRKTWQRFFRNSSKKRSELLSFLDSFAVSQRTTTTNVGLSDVTQFSSTEPDFDSGPEILDPDSNDYFEKMEKENFRYAAPKRKNHTF